MLQRKKPRLRNRIRFDLALSLMLTLFQKKNLKNEDAKQRDQIVSLFLRWVFKESNSEIYFENGWNDHKEDLWDLFQDPSHARALTFGLAKIFKNNASSDSYLKFNFEHTQLQQSADRIARPAGAWYMHGYVRHGYTQMSQVIGAGIGPGSNSQTLDLSLWKKNEVWGIQCERFSHNLDFDSRSLSSLNCKSSFSVLILSYSVFKTIDFESVT